MTIRKIISAVALLAVLFMFSGWASADTVDDPYLRLIAYPGSGSFSTGFGPVSVGTKYFQNTTGSTITDLLVTATSGSNPFLLDESAYSCNTTGVGTGTLLPYGGCSVQKVSNSLIEFRFWGVTIPDLGKFGLNSGGTSTLGRWTDTTTFTYAPVPEPASLSLMGTGVFSLLTRRRRRN